MHLDDGVRIPPVKRGEFQPFLRVMEVGQSFAFPSTCRRRAMVAASAYKAKHPGWNYTVRSEGGETRLWRTA
jgi:hypothetical protein